MKAKLESADRVADNCKKVMGEQEAELKELRAFKASMASAEVSRGHLRAGLPLAARKPLQ